MKVLLSWLREFVDFPHEAERLAEDLTLAGLAVDRVERLGSDVLLDLDITTNRVDCMNVYGIAREVATLYGLTLRPLDIAVTETGGRAAQNLGVEIEAPDLCARFCARVMDVHVSPSPAWLKDRLEILGARSINNIVDVTNYVMLEMGHPTHAFDLARIGGSKLIARWARPEEPLRTLDGMERRLHEHIGVVAGEAGALGIAGIMGGAESEVTSETRTVALEAAYWDPVSIRRASKALGMHTEASHRFERGADIEGPITALSRIGHLLEKVGAGTMRPGLINRYPSQKPRNSASLRFARLNALLGAEVPRDRARAILVALGFDVTPGSDGNALQVVIPSWRSDVLREEDLVEEVARHFGLKNIPSSLPPAGRAAGLSPWQRRERHLRTFLSGAGLNEVINYSFVSPSPTPGSRVSLAMENTGVGSEVHLQNPLSEEQSMLRTSLVLPGLLAALQINCRQGRPDVQLFEIGRVFLAGGTLAVEERHLGLILNGEAGVRHWSSRPRSVDFFDGKGILDALASSLRLEGLTWGTGCEQPYVHPGQAATLLWEGREIGFVGALHPDAAVEWDIKGPTVIAEVNLDPLLHAPEKPLRARSLPRAPAVSRDISLSCDENLPSASLIETIRHAAGPHLVAAELADRYVGPPVPKGKVSLTVSLRYQDAERTLTGEEIQASIESVVARLRADGAEIRQ